MSDVLVFPAPKGKEKLKPLSAKDVDFIGFMTKDDAEFWVNNPEDIVKIFAFIARSGITVYREKE